MIFTILLAGFVFALDNDSNLLNNSDEYEENNENELVGSSCGTVAPGYQNECCVNKGYSGWDDEEFKCTGEQERERNQEGLLGVNANREMNMNQEKRGCEAWKCTKWDACSNGIRTRKCTKVLFNCIDDKEKPRLTRECSEKDELKFYDKLRDCPEDCDCSGSAIKCTFENGTRIMTVYAGNSGNSIVQVKNMNMSTNVTLYKSEDGKVYGIFKNNKTNEIMMPDKIKERIQNRMRVTIQSETMDLTEDGYHIQAQKKARLFFIFPVKEEVEFRVDPETGEVIKTKTRW